MASPLRSSSTNSDSGEGRSQSPEALFISALIEEGKFDPEAWHVSDEDLAAWQQLWNWCRDHQQQSGRAPTPAMLRKTWPQFEIIPDVDPRWAANKLQEAAAARRLRERMQLALGKLKEDDIEGAYTALDGLMVPVTARRAPYDGFDCPPEDEVDDTTFIPVPYEILGRATGGIKPGDVWLFGARLGFGKTTIACHYMAHAVKYGFNCAYFSREMPAKDIKKKINLDLAHRDKELFNALQNEDYRTRVAAHEKLRDRMLPGKFGVYDTTHGPCDPTVIRDALAEFDLVVIDHVELMTLRGESVVRDWRLEAELSNKLKEETLRSGSRLLELVQVNRSGAGGPPTRPPKLEDLAGTDHWGRDCDIGMTGTRFSRSVMTHYAEKVRLGRDVKWYSRFQPDQGRFEQISREQATEIAVRDEDSDARHER